MQISGHGFSADEKSGIASRPRDKTNADKSDKKAEADMKDATVLDPDNYQKSIEAQIDRFEDVDQ